MKFEIRQAAWISVVDELEQEQFDSSVVDFLCVFFFILDVYSDKFVFFDVSKVSQKSNLNTVNKRQKFPFVA